VNSFWIEFRHLEAAALAAEAGFRSWYRSQEMPGGAFSSPGSLIKCQYSVETKGTDGRWQCNYSLIIHSWLITTVQGFQLLPDSHWTPIGWNKHKKYYSVIYFCKSWKHKNSYLKLFMYYIVRQQCKKLFLLSFTFTFDTTYFGPKWPSSGVLLY
jgi:hypothetical protein